MAQFVESQILQEIAVMVFFVGIGMPIINMGMCVHILLLNGPKLRQKDQVAV